MEKRKIYVTQPALPSLNEFLPYLEDIWNSKWVTNNGKFHRALEEELANYLKVKYVSLFANGTLALLTALQTLRISGEVITTPYSFVATSNALWWNNLKPVFVDIEPEFCNLDASKIEMAITNETSAVLPVHVYGNPCNILKIQEIADIYGIKVIYDAAHAFGVHYNGQSVLNYGNLSILSFHATKVYNTMEGGAIISHDLATKKRIDYLKNFGYADEVTVTAPGINSKMNEFQAALGILQLKYHSENTKKREIIAELYKDGLKDISGLRLLEQYSGITNYNYSYFPIFIDEAIFGTSRDNLYNYLKENNIYTRRYFYPLISNFPTYRGLPSASISRLPVAAQISQQVLCLPIYPDLDKEDVNSIINLIKDKS